ncbi:zinc-binding alcohol dehydrogenase family protein [Massilia arenosa]|uniref:Zinc-type alcohol dehydrogenase-like protein n=1 Tax=Zemynaea arenosa TaxID=2561931 RepID=A0A4Y9RNA9_9BURK|nr:zinc-binding alcohol dehydrogenase family protein [Massilia arenosa]TFW10767.1 zinc-binding alcohol dehydrogenase family protein [Massilia arenosa]
MKAIGFVGSDGTLRDIEVAQPVARGHDLLVRVGAVSVNPVDTKDRKGGAPEGQTRILGWDAVGVVEAVGEQVTLFQPGQRVFYAGAIVRDGANSEMHLVDERIVAQAPKTLDPPAAAALPLTSITAWEALFERLVIDRHGAQRGRTLLVIGGAGGVGSIAIQLAAKLAGLTVIATASRKESAEWCRALGAAHVVDHSGDIPAQLKALGFETVDYVLCTNDLDRHFDAIATALAPQGKVCSIVNNQQPLAVEKLFGKSGTLVFELMFTRSSFQTADMIEQHKLLAEVARLVDEGVLRTTVNDNFGHINANNLARAHAALESRRTIGKIVLSGWDHNPAFWDARDNT